MNHEKYFELKIEASIIERDPKNLLKSVMVEEIHEIVAESRICWPLLNMIHSYLCFHVLSLSIHLTFTWKAFPLVDVQSSKKLEFHDRKLSFISGFLPFNSVAWKSRKKMKTSKSIFTDFQEDKTQIILRTLCRRNKFNVFATLFFYLAKNFVYLWLHPLIEHSTSTLIRGIKVEH